ncbi:SDR family oxidoreductase [Nocardioides anomalus]|uniref:SDR family oxidoreductase n=1 Tax=Nocardioides anomalus TaxID=2712223 RepID=A0A6G6WGZ5_9ACTN|nr:SDR family oxidoreductase [Nocardioides anomalus]QIG44502.1 SDR family oxidoreductase [Nocardioides anomalus]
MTRTAIVTGGGAGLGRELALGLAGAGYAVVVADLDEAAARSCATAVEEHGVPARPVRADLRERGDLDHVLAAAQSLGGPDVLVNNAGAWSARRQYPEAAEDEWVATMALNLIAPMTLTQLVLDPMRARGGGVVVNIASSGGIGFEAYGSPEYGAAKAGLIRFTSALAGLADTDAVRVMCVAPDWIGLDRAHEQWRRLSEDERARARPLIPPADVVASVLDLVRHGTGGTVVELWGGEPPVVHTAAPG